MRSHIRITQSAVLERHQTCVVPCELLHQNVHVGCGIVALAAFMMCRSPPSGEPYQYQPPEPPPHYTLQRSDLGDHSPHKARRNKGVVHL